MNEKLKKLLESGTLNIVVQDSFDEPLFLLDANDPYNISFNMHFNPSYINEKLDYKEINRSLAKNMEECDFLFEEDIDFYKYVIDNDINLLETKYVRIPNNKYGKLLLDNNDFNNVTLRDSCDFNREACKELLDIFGDRDDVYLNLKGDYSTVSISAYKKTIDLLGKMVDKINKYDLSPLEKIVYAYDLVRDRVYKEETGLDFTVSRDISSVLFGDEIVCAGYVNVFNALLDELGIDSLYYGFKNINPKGYGHARSLVHVKDEKYNIDGYYMFDPTWDSKTRENDNSYLSSYKFFCKKMKLFYLYDRVFKKSIVDNTFSANSYELVKDAVEIADIIRNNNSFVGLPETVFDYFNKITPQEVEYLNNITTFFSGKTLFSDKFLSLRDSVGSLDLLLLFLPFRFEALNGVLEKVKSLNDDAVSEDKIIDAIYRVRKIEYYEEPDKYPFEYEVFDDIFYDNTMEKDYKKHKVNTAIQVHAILQYLFDDGTYDSTIINNEEETNKEIGLVKFTKTLKLVNERRK